MVKEELTVWTLPYGAGRLKTVRVFVPEHEEGETLPVIYMTDGQTLFEFDKSGKELGSWFTRESVRAEKEKSGRGAIIVGIHNDGAPYERANELTPATIGEFNYLEQADERLMAMFAPQGEKFGEFILNEVKPTVEKAFPVRKGRSSTAFCGSSAGGLEALYMALAHPEIFSFAGIFSLVPVDMIYKHGTVLEWMREAVKNKKELPFLYFYAGGADEMEKQLCMGMEGTFESLKEFYPHELMKKVVMPEQRHHESAWEIVFRDFLKLFLESAEK